MLSGQFDGVDFRSGLSFSISCLVHLLERVKVVIVEKMSIFKSLWRLQFLSDGVHTLSVYSHDHSLSNGTLLDAISCLVHPLERVKIYHFKQNFLSVD